MTTRRTLLIGATGLIAGAGLDRYGEPARYRRAAVRAAAGSAAALPDPAASGIDHIVVVCMENRSFNHLLGWLPGADGRQGGLSYPDQNGTPHPTIHLSTYQGCGHPDPDHSYEGGRVEYRDGACDGWLLVSDDYAIGYYEPDDLDFLGSAAPTWTVCDNYFAATMGPTIPNRLYLHSGQTDRIDGRLTPTSLPTIWDRLAGAGVSRRYYFGDVPVLALWGLRYASISRPLTQFLVDAAAGTLPAVSYVDPAFLGELIDGTSTDYHPHGDVRNGEAFLNKVYSAVTTSPAWPSTVLVITFDEWGGFFDHVPPSVAPDTAPQTTGLRGFRVPTVLVSPRAGRGVVAHDLYDHASILTMIEWRFGLAPLTPRDAAANNLAAALDLAGTPDPTAPQWQAAPVAARACALTGTQPLTGPQPMTGPQSTTGPQPTSGPQSRTGPRSGAGERPSGASSSTAVRPSQREVAWGELRQRARRQGWRLP